MGLEIEKSSFTAQEFRRFNQRLDNNLEALKLLLQKPGFGKGPASLGAELELYIVDRNGHPLSVNREILGEIDDPRLTLELNRYNLEYNLTPVPVRGRPFRGSSRKWWAYCASSSKRRKGTTGMYWRSAYCRP
ncbi:hypothetical protein [Marinobacterium aestuariivivens]|uniref:Glutamate--cysteine ligase n=1 Tax=Marinobacterium aestuariivivens TaxID=1698799 RepID=A0ABW2A1K7_9GAMM